MGEILAALGVGGATTGAGAAGAGLGAGAGATGASLGGAMGGGTMAALPGMTGGLAAGTGGMAGAAPVAGGAMVAPTAGGLTGMLEAPVVGTEVGATSIPEVAMETIPAYEPGAFGTSEISPQVMEAGKPGLMGQLKGKLLERYGLSEGMPETFQEWQDLAEGLGQGMEDVEEMDKREPMQLMPMPELQRPAPALTMGKGRGLWDFLQQGPGRGMFGGGM